jgi:hypothetical protein
MALSCRKGEIQKSVYEENHMSERKIIAITEESFIAFLEQLDKALTDLGVPHYLPFTNGASFAIVLGSESFTDEEAQTALGL